MKKYRVLASETIYYDYIVEAENEEEAHDKAIEYEVSEKDIDDAEGFEFEVSEITE